MNFLKAIPFILFFVFSKNVDFIGLLRGHFMLFYWLSYAGHDVVTVSLFII